MYEGKPVGTPDASNFWRLISRHKVKTMFTAPTALRAIKRVDADGELAREFDLSTLQSLFLAGERADPDTIHWAERALKVPILDHWWITVTGVNDDDVMVMMMMIYDDDDDDVVDDVDDDGVVILLLMMLMLLLSLLLLLMLMFLFFSWSCSCSCVCCCSSSCS